MRIFIPTRDRVTAQYTLQNLSAELRQHTTLVCPEEEVSSHRERSRNAVARPPVPLAGVRQWLVDEAVREGRGNEPLIMLDDDLAFFVRKSPEAHNLRPANEVDVTEIFRRLHALVAPEGRSRPDYVHAGLSPRQGNNWLYPDTVVRNTRMNAVHCVLPAALHHYGIRYDDVVMMEDYHVTLSLFEKAEANAQIADAAWDQVKGSGAPGGFSHYRTKETQSDAAVRLAELHPNSVTVVEKNQTSGQGAMLGVRKDVRVQWVKTFEKAKVKPTFGVS